VVISGFKNAPAWDSVFCFSFPDQCYIIHSMNDNLGAGCVVFVGTALHVVSLGRSCCSASAGLIEIEIQKLNLLGVVEQGFVSGDSCIQRGFST